MLLCMFGGKKSSSLSFVVKMGESCLESVQRASWNSAVSVSRQHGGGVCPEAVLMVHFFFP